MIEDTSISAQRQLESKISPIVSRQKQTFREIWKQHWMLYVMLIPALVLLILFQLYPLWGISIAFVKYNPFRGLAGSEFVGLKNFIDVFKCAKRR